MAMNEIPLDELNAEAVGLSLENFSFGYATFASTLIDTIRDLLYPDPAEPPDPMQMAEATVLAAC